MHNAALAIESDPLDYHVLRYDTSESPRGIQTFLVATLFFSLSLSVCVHCSVVECSVFSYWHALDECASSALIQNIKTPGNWIEEECCWMLCFAPVVFEYLPQNDDDGVEGCINLWWESTKTIFFLLFLLKPLSYSAYYSGEWDAQKVAGNDVAHR